MRHLDKFFFGALLGGLIGGGLALLFAPTSGKKLQSEIVSYVVDVREDVEQAARQRREELEQELARLRQPISLKP